MRTFIKKFKNSIIGKILGAIWKILWWAIEAVIIFIAIIIVVQRVTNNEKAFLGFRIFSVATGSMEPEYAVGDILIAREKDPSTIKVDDNIVYLGNTGDYSGKIITHNVIEVEQNEKGEYLFHTKGIANTVEDPVVHEDQLYGVIFYNNEVLAWLCKILTNRYGLYFFVIIPIILYFFIDFIRIQGERAEQEKEEEKERRRLEAEKRKKKKVKRIEAEEIVEQEDEPEEIVEETPKVTKTKKVTKGASETTKTKKVAEEMPKTTKAKKVAEETQKTTKAKKNAETTPKTAKTKKTTETKKAVVETKKTVKTENGAEKAKRTTKAKKAKEE